jgi:hypothetical protein
VNKKAASAAHAPNASDSIRSSVDKSESVNQDSQTFDNLRKKKSMLTMTTRDSWPFDRRDCL